MLLEDTLEVVELKKYLVIQNTSNGKANSYYDISNLAVKIIVANHILSAVEAAFSANSYNRSLHVGVKMQSRSFGYNRVFYPEFNLSYRL